MKKKLVGIMAVLLLVSAALLYARTRTVGNTMQAGDETYGMELLTDGALVPMTSGTGSLGNATYGWDAYLNDATIDNATISNPVITNVITIHDSWNAPIAASTWVVAGVLGIDISTMALSGAGTTFAETYLTQWDVPRNLGASFVVNKSTNWCYGTATWTGYDAKGVAISEVSIASSTTVNYTNHAFARVTSVVIKLTATSLDYNGVLSPSGGMSQIDLNLATGVKLGLSGNLVATTDVIAVVENGTGIAHPSIAALFDATYDTYDPSTDPAATYRECWYKSDSN